MAPDPTLISPQRAAAPASGVGLEGEAVQGLQEPEKQSPRAGGNGRAHPSVASSAVEPTESARTTGPVARNGNGARPNADLAVEQVTDKPQSSGSSNRPLARSEEVNAYWSRRFREFRQQVLAEVAEERNAMAHARRRLTRQIEKLTARSTLLKERNRELYRISRNPFYRVGAVLFGRRRHSEESSIDLDEKYESTSHLVHTSRADLSDAELQLDELELQSESSPVDSLIQRWRDFGSRDVARLAYLRSCTGAESLRSNPTDEELELAPEPEEVDGWIRDYRVLSSRPLFSLLIPIHATPPDVLHSTFQSVLDQVYGNWEMCLAVDEATGEDSCNIIAGLQERHPGKVRSVRLEGTPGIVAGSNAAAELASGDFVGLLDHDDVLTPDALLQVAHCLSGSPEADLIYSDEDKLTPLGKVDHPFYKPDFSPELLDSFNYITHFTVIRRTLFEQVGGFREGFDGSQDYDLILRVSEQARKVEHVPRPLYHWRMVEGSTASDIRAKGDPFRQASYRALQDALRRRGETAVVEPGRAPDTYRVRYAVDPETPVTIIIPTKDNVEHLRQCVESIHELSMHRAFEILVISNNTERREALDYLDEASSRGQLRYLKRDIPFNYSALNNFAVQHTDRPFLLFLNDDTKVISPGWITAMLEQAQRAPIGVVGARLLYEDRTIQHGGLIVGCGGVADHAFRGAAEITAGYFNNLRTVRNCGAVTGACMMVRREVFEQAGGMDEALAVAFNDVDFCLRVGRAGYRNVFTPYAELFHYESKSRGYADSEEKIQKQNEEAQYVCNVWGESLFRDPYYNPNLSLVRNNYTPRTRWDREIEMTFRLNSKSPL